MNKRRFLGAVLAGFFAPVARVFGWSRRPKVLYFSGRGTVLMGIRDENGELDEMVEVGTCTSVKLHVERLEWPSIK